MLDGWEYVAAVYGLTALVLAIWFWMVLRKLRAHPPAVQERADG